MQRAMASLLEGIPGDAHQQAVAQDIASLPMRMGGLGIRSASRLAPAAFWASWADALPMLEKRLPPLAAEITTILEGEQVEGCLGELQLATRVLGSNTCLNLASGRMVGSTSRLPLPSTTFRRPFNLPNRAPQTRLICVHTRSRSQRRLVWMSHST